MESLETFRPKLKKGAVLSQQDRVVFELERPFKTVILPVEAEAFLKNFDGEKTISDILKLQWNEQGHVHFRSLVYILDRLRKYDCLENSSDIPSREHWEEHLSARVHALTKPFFTIPLFEKMKLPALKPVFYVIAALFVADVAFLALTNTDPIFQLNFLKIHGSYLAGLFGFLLLTSILISFKNIVKTALLLFATGTAARGTLQLNLFSFAYRVDDGDGLMAMSKFEAAVFSVAAVAAPFFFAALFKSFSADLLPVALILTLVDMDPYIGSEFTRLFKRFYADLSLNDLVPYLRKKALTAVFQNEAKLKRELLFSVYSALTIAWTFVALNFCGRILNITLTQLTAAIVARPLPEKIGAVLILLGIVLVNFYLIWDLIALFSENLMNPFKNRFHEARKQKLKAEKPLDAGEIRDIVRDISLFSGLNEKFTLELFANAEVKKFPAGYHVIIQDTPATKMYFLLQGSVEIVRREPSGYNHLVAELSAPTVFGEMGVVQEGKRTADVIAKTPVRVAMIDKATLQNLKATAHASQITELLSRIMLQQYLASSSLFSDLPKEVIRVFTNEGQFRELPSGHTIFNQGEAGDSFYLLVRGKVDVIADNKRIQQIEEGGFFGEIALLTNSPRSATVRTVEPCVVLRIDRTRFWGVITQNMNLALCIEKVAESRISENAKLHTHKEPA